MAARYDAVICGAGVAGLTLAKALSTYGMRVLMADRHHGHPKVFKGELLQPRSLQICAELGVLPALRARGALVTTRLACRKADGSEVGALDYRLLPGAFNYCLVHDYHVITEVMTGSLGPGVDLERGTRVDGLIIEGGRVTGVELTRSGRRHRVIAPLIAGCDGATSTVRKHAGIQAHSYAYEHDLLALELEDVTGIGPDVAAHLTPGGLRLLYALPGARARLYIQLRRGELRAIGRAGLARWADQVVVSTPALEPVSDALRAALPGARAFAARRFAVSRWTLPGLALLGDAAHCVHPMAGQGMNAAIADGFDLASRLAAARSPDEALAGYERARGASQAYVGRLSHSMATLFTSTSWLTRVLGHRMLHKNQANRRMQYVLTYNMSGLGVYRFTPRDRLIQFGLMGDPMADFLPESRCRPQLGYRA